MCFVRFIPNFIVFDTILKLSFILLISINLNLSSYRNIIDYCTLIIHPSTSLNSICLVAFCTFTLVFYIDNPILVSMWWWFHFFLSNPDASHFLFHSHWNLLEPSLQYWTEVVRVDNLEFILILGSKIQLSP